MKFKKLILQGFKSFVDRTVIEFPDGITAIVGPNGSGKSNILDAIRWILGEQNPKELRGSDMDDIIFAGSESRKGSNLAYVTLVISDIEDSIAAKWGSFSEIEITRRYYRDGEREYYINNKRCKLKDIKEIFYDTGLGARSISIIEQGKVEKIITASPEEMRAFFDEAAGIVKFKEKKKEAEKRLEQSKENLARVHDIIHEVKQKRDILSLQVKDLTLYKTLTQEKHRLEKILLTRQYISLNEQLDENIKKQNNLQYTISEKLAEYEKLKHIDDTLKEDLSRLDKELKDINTKILDTTEKLSKLYSETSVIENNIKNAEQTKDNIHNEIESIEKRLKELTKNRETNLKLLEEIAETIKEKSDILYDYESELTESNNEKSYIEDNIDENREKFLDIAEKNSSMRNQQIRLDSEINRLNKEIEKLNSEKIKILDEQKQLEEVLIQKGASVERLNLEIEIFKDNLKDLENELKKINQNIDEISKIINEMSANKISKENILNKIEIDLKNESFGKEISAIFSPEEIALLLDYDIDEELKYFYGDIIVFKKNDMDDCLNKIEEINSPIRFIFENDIDKVLKEVKNRQFEKISKTISKIDGIYYKNGEIDRANKILSLKSEINELRKEISELNRSLDLSKSELEQLLLIKSEKVSEIEKNRSELNNYDKQLSSYNIEIKNLNIQKEQYNKRILTVNREINFNQDELKKLIDKSKENENILDTLSEQQRELEDEHEVLTSKLEEIEEKIEFIKEKIYEAKLDLSTLKEKENSAKKDLLYIEREINSASTKMGHLKERLSKLLTVDITNWKNNLQNNKIRIDELEKNKIELQDKKLYLENQILQKNEDLKRNESILNEISKELKSLESSLQNLKLKIVQLKTSSEVIENSFTEKFNDNIKNHLDIVKDTSENLNNIKEKILELESSINAIGPLNM
ncbi:MAG: AAA family ATPase, partial [Deferribacterales bacterium]